MSILVVDDEKEVRESLCAVLRLAGYEAVAAASGKEALKYISEGKFRLMLLDLTMPGMSGGELINVLRRQEQKLPVLVITTLASWQTAGLLGQGVGYIRKPVDADLLLGAVETLI